MMFYYKIMHNRKEKYENEDLKNIKSLHFTPQRYIFIDIDTNRYVCKIKILSQVCFRFFFSLNIMHNFIVQAPLTEPLELTCS